MMSLSKRSWRITPALSSTLRAYAPPVLRNDGQILGVVATHAMP